MYRSIGLGLVLAVIGSHTAYAETCFINSSRKAVSINMKELIVEQPSVRLQPGQRRCFDERAKFTVTASFHDELNDYWRNKLDYKLLIAPEPQTWLERYLNGLIESNQIVVVNSVSPEIAYIGPLVPIYEHRGDTVLSNQILERDMDIEILFSDEKAVRATIRNSAVRPEALVQNCPTLTVPRAQSAHSYVTFKLPSGTDGQDIRIPSGAHSRYYFPTCHRVHWNDHVYRCENGKWRRIKGEAGADILCHGNTPKSPYIQAGYRE